MGIERRRYIRFSKELPVLAELPDGHRLAGTTCDLSQDGARLRLDHRLPSGVQLMVELNPPGNAAQTDEIYTLWANVLHSRNDNPPSCELGIQYAHAPEHYLQLIARLGGPVLHRAGPQNDII